MVPCDNWPFDLVSQTQNGRERVITYASRSLNCGQREYCATWRKLLAVVVKNGVKKFCHYVGGGRWCSVHHQNGSRVFEIVAVVQTARRYGGSVDIDPQNV